MLDGVDPRARGQRHGARVADDARRHENRRTVGQTEIEKRAVNVGASFDQEPHDPTLAQGAKHCARVDAPLRNLCRAGASPRGTINLALTARARAFMNGRAFVTPQDVKDLVHDVLRHRILLSYEAEAEDVTTDAILDRILAKVPVP